MRPSVSDLLDNGIRSISTIIFLSFSDTDGRALLGRFQTKTQDLEADDQEVKVQVVKIPFKFLGTHCVYCAPLPRCPVLQYFFPQSIWFVFLESL